MAMYDLRALIQWRCIIIADGGSRFLWRLSTWCTRARISWTDVFILYWVLTSHVEIVFFLIVLHSVCEYKTSPFGQRCVWSGHLGTYWDISGHFGTFRDILGHFGTFRDILGHFGTFRDIPGHFRRLYDEFGAFGPSSQSLPTIFTHNRLIEKNASRTGGRTLL